MKQTFNIISIVSILLFLVVYILNHLFKIDFLIKNDVANLLVVIYLVARLLYYRIDNLNKTKEINSLKYQLSKNTNNSQQSI